MAISYTYTLLPRLSRYVNDGRINIDNNLIENAIRPLALGRKNWLFCGNIYLITSFLIIGEPSKAYKNL